jgi:SAM-dependent methyltransferase
MCLGLTGVMPMVSWGEHEPGVSAAAYDRELVPWLFEHWAEPMVDVAAPLPSSRIVDLACGSGLIVRQLLGRLDGSGLIHGVDLDAEMLGYAATTVDDPRVSWYEADATRLPFDDDSIDRVCCHQGLQFFPDRPAVLAEVRRVLVPDGRLAVAVWGQIGHNPWPAALATAVGRFVGDRAGEDMAVVCDLGDPDELGAVLDQAGFEGITVDVHERTATHPDVAAAVAGQLAALPSGSAVDKLVRERRTELIDLMCELLADYVDPGGQLAVPSTSTFASAVNSEGMRT